MLITTQDRAAGADSWRRLGKVKLGIKVKNKNAYADGTFGEHPEDVDYFVIPPEYQAKLGEKPKELAIVLANPDLRQNFDTRAAYYVGNGSRACHTSDGRIAHRYMRTEGATKHAWCDIECPGAACQFRQEKKCKERGYFSFMLPATGEIGTFLMVMGTQVGMNQIYATLLTVAALCSARLNGMQGIRLKLRREPRDFYQDLKGDGQQAKITKYIPMVEIDYAQLLRADQQLLGPMLGQPVLLPAAEPGDPSLHDDADEE